MVTVIRDSFGADILYKRIVTKEFPLNLFRMGSSPRSSGVGLVTGEFGDGVEAPARV
jgi:hypothetical protein